jgi:hypothetical protein
VSLRDGFIVEAISSSVVETATLGYAFLEVILFVRILSVISIRGTTPIEGSKKGWRGIPASQRNKIKLSMSFWRV